MSHLFPPFNLTRTFHIYRFTSQINSIAWFHFVSETVRSRWPSPTSKPFSPPVRLVHSGPGKSSPLLDSDLSFGLRSGTKQGVETHVFRVDSAKDLSAWTHLLVEGCHNAAELIKEVTTGADASCCSSLRQQLKHHHNGLKLGQVMSFVFGESHVELILKTGSCWHVGRRFLKAQEINLSIYVSSNENIFVICSTGPFIHHNQLLFQKMPVTKVNVWE